ncbi:MAG: radical SAM protein [Deltaproteobacteria bacterium]|nr:radical SAM protein [Deltaproteobacteria bacterium]
MADRIDLKVGFACNNHCHFCVQGDKRLKWGAKPVAELRQVLEEGRPAADGLVFTGGEPTLRRDLPDLIAYARELGYKTIQIQSNGRMFAHKGYCKLVIERGANEFSPALHGHLAALHDYLVAAPGAWSQTVQGIRNLKSLGQYVLTNSVITKSNFRHLPELARLLTALGVDQFQFAFVHPTGTAGKEFSAVVPRMAMAAPYLMQALRLGQGAGRRVTTEAVPYCILPGYEDCVVEKYIPRTAVFDAECIIADYTKYRHEEGKAKGPDCRHCKFDVDCEGPWREYPERFGWEEFRPVHRAAAAKKARSAAR